MRPSEFERLKPLALPAYAVAALLIVIPLADTALALLPPRPGDVSWRFGALGLGSQAVMTPLLGVLLALAAAAVLGHRRGIRVIQILSWLVAVTLFGMIVLFVLDAIQMRSSVQPEAKGLFDKASLVALAKHSVGVLVSLMFAIGSHRLVKRMPTGAGPGAAKPELVYDAPAAGDRAAKEPPA